MSKYKELKARIGRVGKATTIKEVDDILREINPIGLWLTIKCSTDIVGSVNCVEITNITYSSIAHFSAETQQEKNEALKKALMWLLNKSDIKKRKGVS